MAKNTQKQDALSMFTALPSVAKKEEKKPTPKKVEKKAEEPVKVEPPKVEVTPVVEEIKKEVPKKVEKPASAKKAAPAKSEPEAIVKVSTRMKTASLDFLKDQKFMTGKKYSDLFSDFQQEYSIPKTVSIEDRIALRKKVKEDRGTCTSNLLLLDASVHEALEERRMALGLTASEYVNLILLEARQKRGYH